MMEAPRPEKNNENQYNPEAGSPQEIRPRQGNLDALHPTALRNVGNVIPLSATDFETHARLASGVESGKSDYVRRLGDEVVAADALEREPITEHVEPLPRGLFIMDEPGTPFGAYSAERPA